MAQAYAVIMADAKLFDSNRRDTVQEAQHAADKRFEEIAQEARLTKVVRTPEPHIMTHSEIRNHLPHANLDGLVGLFFTADIS